jgi:GMP synthase (glutamine-hydrolysing)
MRNLKLLVVEGNNKADNANFLEAGCVSQSENFIKHIKMFQTNCDIDKVEPVNDNAIFKAVNSMKKYDGIILTGGAMRINDYNSEIKKHIDFAKKCFEHEKKIFASCWGLQVVVEAAGGKVRPSPNGAHIGIAFNVELTNEGKNHKAYLYKNHKFTTPAFNFDEVEIPPKNSILLASDKINKFMALHFTVAKSEIWGFQYHPEVPYEYMLKLIKMRSSNMIDKQYFKNENELQQHIDSIEKEDSLLTYNNRTIELKNWLRYVEKSAY